MNLRILHEWEIIWTIMIAELWMFSNFVKYILKCMESEFY